MKVLVNYKKTKEQHNNLVVVQLLMDREVMVDLPICAVDFGEEYTKPVLFGNYKGIPTVVELEAALNYINDNLKEFTFIADENGKLVEVEKGSKDAITLMLPKDTDLSQLYMEGNMLKKIVMVEAENDEQ